MVYIQYLNIECEMLKILFTIYSAFFSWYDTPHRTITLNKFWIYGMQNVCRCLRMYTCIYTTYFALLCAGGRTAETGQMERINNRSKLMTENGVDFIPSSGQNCHHFYVAKLQAISQYF